MTVTRRQLLNRLAYIGGSGMVYGAMNALGLTGDTAFARAALPPGGGRRILVLGAGIAGLVATYELERSGYDVTLLEARDRVGGRNWTVRNGTRVQMNGEEDQIAEFSEGGYMNAGPARLPSFHTGILGYCKELGVKLEVEVNSSRSAYIVGDSGGAVRMRQAINDTRGWLSELLAKAVNKGALDQDLTSIDKEKLVSFLRVYGDLDEKYLFEGTTRSGFAMRPGAADQMEKMISPLPLRDLIGNAQLPMTLFEDNVYMQATMFQPTGGMDQIPMGFERALKKPIVKNTEIIRLTQSGKGVKIIARDRNTGAQSVYDADYAIVTIPLVVLSKIPGDFSPAYKRAIASVPYDSSNKIGFDTPRFWEQEQIYGGISFVGGETALIWYPTAGLYTPRGVLLATYNSGARAITFAKRPIAEQIEMARAAVERVHPGHSGDLTKPIAVNWSKIPYNLGPWPNWDPAGGLQEGHNDSPAYRLLNQPDGRFYLCGAHLSQTPGWQEGAVQSAHRTLAALASRLAATA